MELIEKSYNLDYSDTRLRQIETLLKSLSNEPSGTDTLIERADYFRNFKIIYKLIKH